MGDNSEHAHSYSGLVANGSGPQHNGAHYGNQYNYYGTRQQADNKLPDESRCKALYIAAADGEAIRVEHLLNLGAGVDYTDAYGLTALHRAVLGGVVEVVKLLIERGAHVNAISGELGTPLHFACLAGSVAIVKLLLSHHAIVSKVGSMVATPLHCAVFAKQAEIVEEMLKAGASVSTAGTIIPNALRKLTSDFDTWSSAFSAAHLPSSKNIYTAYSGSAWALGCDINLSPIAKMLHQSHSWKAAKNTRMNKWTLKGLGSLETPDTKYKRDGITIFMLAAQSSGSNTLEFLLETFGHDLVNARDSSNWTALHYAAYDDRAKCADALIRVGAGINSVTADGSTPLMLAAAAGKEKSLARLVTRGALVTARDHSGQTALHRASTPRCVSLLLEHKEHKALLTVHGDDDLTPLLKFAADGQVELLKTMIDQEVNVKSVNRLGETALYMAAKYNHVDCIQLLLKHGATIGMKTHEGWTALGMAVCNGSAAAVEALLQTGIPDPDTSHGGEISLLTLAAKHGKMPIVSILLAAKANPNGWDPTRIPEGERTPLEWACYRGTIRMVRALLEAEANPDLPAAYTAPNTAQDEIVKLMRDYIDLHHLNTPEAA